jgi:hypothetical protein
MPFCTKCGANVAGSFCSQCGTPAASSGAFGSTPVAGSTPPVVAAPYGQPVPRKTSPIVWVLVVVLGLFVVGGIAVAGFAAFVAHRIHQAGVSFDRNSNGGVTFRGKDGIVEFGGSSVKLPSWVPVYPGSEGHAKFAVRGSGDTGEGGVFSFTTSDSADRVKSFYLDKAKDLGMKVNLDTTTPDGGMFVAVDEDGEKRSLTVTINGRSGENNVSVMYGRK